MTRQPSASRAHRRPLTIFDGTSAQVTLLSDLSNDATVVTYFQDVDNSGTHNAGDMDFFKLTLSGGNYTFDVLQDPPPAELDFGFAGAPSGSNLFMTFGDPNSTQIVVIGQDPLNQSQGGNINTKDVLNISQAGSTTSFGVNGNQINPDEGAFITYVTGANTNFLVPNLDQNEADVEANIDFQNVFNATAASFTVNQTNPGVGPVTVKITAFDTAAEPGVNFVDGLTNDTQVNIHVGLGRRLRRQDRQFAIYSGRHGQRRRHLDGHRPEHRRQGAVDDGVEPTTAS